MRETQMFGMWGRIGDRLQPFALGVMLYYSFGEDRSTNQHLGFF